MPKVPKWMANAMESLFSGSYHPVQVTAVEDLASGLRKVCFEGDFSKSKKEFVAGNAIEFRINDTEFRHYTPSHFNQEAGVCEVWFYLHDKGPGSKWVIGLKPGQQLKLLGPGGKIKYDAKASCHVAFGDETSLGLFECLSAEARKQGHSFVGIAELDNANRPWAKVPDGNVVSTPKNDQEKGSYAIVELNKWLQNQAPERETIVFYLTGNAKSIVALKKSLLDQGFKSAQIQTEPYWSEGKPGL
ncbi:MAG: oxidoreductase [Cytophagaceae bacterium SCN 52-12]|nr:MAG: oxidoreductase [Cytophagaceae bacterium SCN 52-12]